VPSVVVRPTNHRSVIHMAAVKPPKKRPPKGVLFIRVSEVTRVELEQAAAADRRSMSSMAEILLDEALAARRAAAKKR